MDFSVVGWFSFYLALLSSFCFFSHALVNCVVLVLSVLSLCYSVYLLLGFSWYICMFCIVYVGGVYILLIFVFLCCSNSGVIGGFGCFVWVFGVYFVSLFILSFAVIGDSYADTSLQLGSYGYRWGYLFLCVGLMVSLAEASIICSNKNSFYR